VNVRLTKDCPMCGRQMSRRNGKTGDFLGCSAWPRCKHTEPFDAALDDIHRRLRAAEWDRTWFHDAMSEIKTRVREVILLAHPDRWPSSQNLANRVTARLNELMDKL
jgi:ssDNA-binding Zn-finger/Zn-ribbon topoisomerase 1